jgi:3-methylcrotonyl-CoA carboxylase alpha subunit
MNLQVSIDGAPLRDVLLTRTERGATIWIDGIAHRATLSPTGRAFQVALDDRMEQVWLAVDHDHVYVHALGRAWDVEVIDPLDRSKAGADQADLATAPMPGTVVTVVVESGEEVATGQPLVVIESMKMQSEIVAWRDGVVDSIHVEVGETFDRGARLVALMPEGAPGE